MDEKEKRRQRFLTAPLFPLLISTAIPTMIGMMVSIIYNLTDTFWIGKLQSKSMTAAIGVVYAFVSMIQALGFWFGYGSGNTMSRLLGAKDEASAKAVANDANIMAVVSGVIISIAGFILIEPLLRLLGADASGELYQYSEIYLKIILFTVPFNMLSVTVYNQLRLCGNVKDAMIGLLVGMLGNIVLDPVFIMIFNMGIAGAGIATLIGNVGSTVTIVWLSFKHGNIPVSFHFNGFSKERIYHILVVGMPNFSRQGITALASMLLNNAAAVYGDGMIAALTVSTRIATLGYMLMIGFGQGFQPICAMNYGAGYYDRVKKALKITTAVGSMFLIISSVAIYRYAGELCSLFLDNASVNGLASEILRYQCISLPFLGIYAISSMFMQNVGQYMKALVISVARQGIFFIPLLYILPHLFNETGIMLIQPAADILSVVLGLVIVIKSWRNVFK